jgi:hypothetical protein
MKKTMNTPHRLPCTIIFKNELNNTTDEAEYKSGYTTFIVKSHFNGPQKFTDLLFDILLKSQGEITENL